MLNLSRRVEYGLMALSHMAAKGGERPIAARTIAAECSIPPELLGKVLQALTRAGLVHATPGAQGGYRLAKSLEQLTLGSVVEALEGPVRLTRCQCSAAKCDRFLTCTIRKPVSGIQSQLVHFVHGVSLSSLKRNAPLVSPAEREQPRAKGNP
jgi:Rrf2 family protein